MSITTSQGMKTSASIYTKLFPLTRTDLSESVKQGLHTSFVKTDKFMLKLLLIHWAVASTVTAFSYNTYLLGFIGGGLVYGLAYASVKTNPGSLWSRMTIGAHLWHFQQFLFSSI